MHANQPEKDGFSWLEKKLKAINLSSILEKERLENRFWRQVFLLFYYLELPPFFFLIISRRIILHNLMLRFIKFIGFLSDNKTFIIRSYLHGTIKLWSIFM